MSWRGGVIAVAAALAVAGCAATDRPLTRIPAGSELHVNRTIEIPPDEARVYIQDGEVVSLARSSRFRARCSIGLRREVRGQPLVRTIEPGVFTTGEARRYYRVNDDSPSDVRLAAAGLVPLGSGLMISNRERERVWQVRLFTEARLHNPDQPQVHHIRCVRDTWATPGAYLSIDEVRATLDDLITIELLGEN